MSRRPWRERGYGREHKRLRKKLAQAVALGAATCARCGGAIEPGEPWDLDHTDDRTGYLGPSHAACNRAAGNRSRAARHEPGRTSRVW